MTETLIAQKLAYILASLCAGRMVFVSIFSSEKYQLQTEKLLEIERTLVQFSKPWTRTKASNLTTETLMVQKLVLAFVLRGNGFSIFHQF